MHLFDLPLECFRHMLTFITYDLNFVEHRHEFLRLRLLCRFMDAEVMHALGTPTFIRRKRHTLEPLTTTFFYALGSRPSSNQTLPLCNHYVDFIASFLFTRSHLQEPWNANISGVLNHVVDALLAADGLDINDGSRKVIMRNLCRRIFAMRRWKETKYSGWFSAVLFPRPQHLNFQAETESLEFNVVLASIILGRRATFENEQISDLLVRKSIIFGTVLDSSIMGGQVELVTTLLNTGMDVNDESLKILETAVQCENTKMLHVLFSPQYNLQGSTRRARENSRIEKAVNQAVDNDQTESALFLIRNADITTYKQRSIHAFGYACLHNNFTLVNAMFHELKLIDVGALYQQRMWVVMLVIFYGHKDMLHFLLNIGIRCSDAAMMIPVAARGDLSMAHYLIHERGAKLSPNDWYEVLRVAVSHGQVDFIEALLSDPLWFINQDVHAHELFQYPINDYLNLFTQACQYGNLCILQSIADAGVRLDQGLGDNETPPVLELCYMGRHMLLDCWLKWVQSP